MGAAGFGPKKYTMASRATSTAIILRKRFIGKFIAVNILF
jgi:hypothetical protein